MSQQAEPSIEDLKHRIKELEANLEATHNVLAGETRMSISYRDVLRVVLLASLSKSGREVIRDKQEELCRMCGLKPPLPAEESDLDDG
jgi:type IV pilus biogenesis protein CpaD/CtpE